MDPRCPDCSVSMQRTTPFTALQNEKVRLRTSERREGLLGSLGAKRSLDVHGYLCPSCGLVRWYADLDELQS